MEFDNLIEEDHLLHVSRTLDISNRSITKINYRNVPLSVLRKIMEQIIDIHSQHKDNSFFDERKQINFVDSYSFRLNYPEIKNINDIYCGDIQFVYSTHYNQYISEKKKLQELLDKQSSFEDLELLTYQFNELEKANIQENEIEDIETELKNLESFEELSNAIDNFESNYNQISSLMYSSRKQLQSVKSDLFNAESEKFNDLYYEFEDLHDEIINKYNHLSNNQSRLEELRERKSLLYGLRRKYGRTTNDILNYFKSIKDEIDLINNFDYIIENQKKSIEILENELNSVAKDISKIRKITSKCLEEEINKQLHDLLLANSDFKIEINQTELNKNGYDEVIFKLRANAGGKYLSLQSTASLGETSRINLALKTVLNALNPVGTVIFDEIDTGISGKVATKVSKKIYEISKVSQTIVITHLPQVSARGDHHYFVSKYVENNLTKTKIDELNNEEVTNNIAYMMTGESPTSESIALAKQLIESIK